MDRNSQSPVRRWNVLAASVTIGAYTSQTPLAFIVTRDRRELGIYVGTWLSGDTVGEVGSSSLETIKSLLRGFHPAIDFSDVGSGFRFGTELTHGGLVLGIPTVTFQREGGMPYDRLVLAMGDVPWAVLIRTPRPA